MEYYSVPWPTSGASTSHPSGVGSSVFSFFAACCVRTGGFLRVRLTVKAAVLFIFFENGQSCGSLPPVCRRQKADALFSRRRETCQV